ncbi:MAG: DUF815 domain-containing protein [Gammaproteobacteria bacterium]
MTKTSDNENTLSRIADSLSRIADCAEQQTGMPPKRILQALADGGSYYRWRAAQAGGVLTAMAAAGESEKAEHLRGLQKQTDAVRDNTARFLSGKPAHNILISGARGCGKSSVMRAVLSGFAKKGGKLMETDGEGLAKLPFLLAALAQTKDAFIVFCDDLSFATESPPALVRSALEGSFFADARVLIYATANRRHLSRSMFSDADDIHPGETEDEKLALADRFGLSLRIYPPEVGEYEDITADWLHRYGIKPSPSLLRQARAYADRRGGRSGRVAKQFALAAAAQK